VSDDEAGAAIGEEIGRIDALLLGRKTYDIFARPRPAGTSSSPRTVRHRDRSA
jgi:hypothetical protein